MSNVIGLLIILLSEPKDPIVFGVVQEFRSYGECLKVLSVSELPHKERLMCLPVLRPTEV